MLKKLHSRRAAKARKRTNDVYLEVKAGPLFSRYEQHIASIHYLQNDFVAKNYNDFIFGMIGALTDPVKQWEIVSRPSSRFTQINGLVAAIYSGNEAAAIKCLYQCEPDVLLTFLHLKDPVAKHYLGGKGVVDFLADSKMPALISHFEKFEEAHGIPSGPMPATHPTAFSRAFEDAGIKSIAARVQGVMKPAPAAVLAHYKSRVNAWFSGQKDTMFQVRYQIPSPVFSPT